MQDIPVARLHADVSTFSSCRRFSTWAGTYSCTPLTIIEPKDVNQCRMAVELARREGRSLRVSGVGHSPSDVACTSEYMLSTLKLNNLISVSNLVLFTVARCLISFLSGRSRKAAGGRTSRHAPPHAQQHSPCAWAGHANSRLNLRSNTRWCHNHCDTRQRRRLWCLVDARLVTHPSASRRLAYNMLTRSRVGSVPCDALRAWQHWPRHRRLSTSGTCIPSARRQGGSRLCIYRALLGHDRPLGRARQAMVVPAERRHVCISE